jgi:hypothetical protein
MNSLRTKLSPKEFIHVFVLLSDSDVAYLQRHWAQPKGISSTIELVNVIGHEIKKTKVGRAAWAKFVQKEVRQSQSFLCKFFLKLNFDFISNPRQS